MNRKRFQSQHHPNYTQKEITSKFKYNGKTIFFICVKHHVPILDSTLRTIKKWMERSDMCILLELDTRLSFKQITEIKQFYEASTTKIVNEFKSTINPCIKGWDIRPSILGENAQNNLYGTDRKGTPHFFRMSLGDIENAIIKPQNLLQKKDLYRQFIGLKKKINVNVWNKRSLLSYDKDKDIPHDWLVNLMHTLRIVYKDIADSYILKLINKSNYIDNNIVIIVGDTHYNDMIKKFNQWVS